MNALEREVTNAAYEWQKKHGEMPKYAECTIRHNDGEFVTNMVFALYEYDCDVPTEIDNKVFFFTGNFGTFFSLLANLDFLEEDFFCMDDFMQEVDKYSTDDRNSPDWSYLHRGEDFCIVSFDCFFDSFDNF